MRVLVACEESGSVTEAFRDAGHQAFSCDVLPTSGRFPEYHIQDDVRNHLIGWDLIIAFPPCDHLATSGARWFEQKRQDGRQQAAIEFFMEFVRAPAPHICIENPVGIMSSHFRSPDQIVHPWMYGHEAHKSTCLWLINLPKLVATQIVDRGEMRVYPDGRLYPKWISDAPQSTRKRIRSRTFDGVARAMANQWGGGTKQLSLWKPASVPTLVSTSDAPSDC